MKSKPLKIWILEIGEPLPIEPSVRLHRYGLFSKWLASQGHEVTWWTSSFSHAPKKNFVSKDCEVFLDGVVVRFILGKGYKRNISFARIKHQAAFARKFLVQAEEMLADTAQKPDVILAPIPTIDGALAAVDFGLKHLVPVIVDIRDLWPDEIRDLAPGYVKYLAQLALFGAYRKLRKACTNATAICGVSQSYLNYGLKWAGRPKDLDFVFPLGYWPQQISDNDKALAETWWQSLGISPDAFVSCFFGTIGKFFDLSTVLQGAKMLGEKYVFILGGDGSSLKQFQKEALELKNVIFTGWLNTAQIQVVMRHSQMGLAPYAKNAKMSLPNKPFEYMSAGLPVVSSIQHELKEILALNQAGITYPADSVQEFTEAIQLLHKDSDRREKMSRNARAVFERDFSGEKVFANALNHLQAVVSKGRQ